MEMGQSTSESEVDGGPLDIPPSPEPREDMGEGIGPGIGAGMSSEHTYSTVSKVPTSESTAVSFSKLLCHSATGYSLL